ncbi:hypothetical protein KORDIASMS9_04609 [Kordia sp. SMS9]|uniref:hypothetical protein n=1 Tax=Kordia sp. SMS9 TaxID=2282170 RepID=UPI000E0DB26B|nr:hypothetical protein [Kordia sp. SMS9]AXG72338.1 hypothetical protein KORDIASMS9_04609 [Kordia sp. SMS9]
MKTFRGFLIFVAIFSVIGAAKFGSVEIKDYNNSSINIHEVTSHSGANGGAIGFGLLGGMCFIAIAITYIGREEN